MGVKALSVLVMPAAMATLASAVAGTAGTRWLQYAGPPSLPRHLGRGGIQRPALPAPGASLASPAVGRRLASALGGGPFLGFMAAAVGLAGAGSAARAKSTRQDLQRLAKGYRRLVYLLDNFEEETTVCNPDCNRTPDKVRQYLGLKSTADPLFNSEKLLIDATEWVKPGMVDEYQEAVEKWCSAIAGANGEAFISSFGEYNPGGGKGQVDKYIERARENVILAKKNLEVIAKALDLDLTS